jgi:hypothetical protein
MSYGGATSNLSLPINSYAIAREKFKVLTLLMALSSMSVVDIPELHVCVIELFNIITIP